MAAKSAMSVDQWHSFEYRRTSLSKYPGQGEGEASNPTIPLPSPQPSHIPLSTASFLSNIDDVRVRRHAVRDRTIRGLVASVMRGTLNSLTGRQAEFKISTIL
jgi:hypothetical protein